VKSVRPDLSALAALGVYGVNCFAGSGRRWKTRMFAPALGVPEDPATGSAAGPIAAHLARHGQIAFGEQIELRQGAEIGRPSVLYARAEGSKDKLERIEVGGSAVPVARGQFQRW
jgi:trans-2,3-dihydro-3-hydroxyanthranilate isomerase